MSLGELRSTDHDLVALGEPLVVMAPDRPGPLRAVPRFERGLGGAECNTLLGFARLGGSGGLISRLGDDEFGAFLAGTLQANSIDLQRLQYDADGRTGLYFKEVSPLPDGSRAIYYREQSPTAQLQLDLGDLAYIEAARAFLTTGVTALLSEAANASVALAMRTAREAAVPVYFDPNLRQGLWGSGRARELIAPLIPEADVFLGGEVETRELTGAQGAVEIAEAVRELGPREVVIKRGSRGAVAIDEKGEVHRQEAVPVAAIDTVGAGDAFNAGYLRYRQLGASVAEALRVGALCGASVVTGTGDFETFPRPGDLSRFLPVDEPR
jgi:2-dehydro-3-deoxygluconokinase